MSGATCVLASTAWIKGDCLASCLRLPTLLFFTLPLRRFLHQQLPPPRHRPFHLSTTDRSPNAASSKNVSARGRHAYSIRSSQPLHQQSPPPTSPSLRRPRSSAWSLSLTSPNTTSLAFPSSFLGRSRSSLLGSRLTWCCCFHALTARFSRLSRRSHSFDSSSSSTTAA